MSDPFSPETPTLGLNRQGMNEVLQENMDKIDEAVLMLQNTPIGPGSDVDGGTF